MYLKALFSILLGGFWLNFLLLLITSALAASGLIVSKKPNASEILNKINPYKGILGLAVFIFGIVNFFKSIELWGDLFDIGLVGIVMILMILLDIVIGFLLGYGMVAKYITGGAKEKMDQMNAKLVAFQNPLGLAGIVIAIALIILYFTWDPMSMINL